MIRDLIKNLVLCIIGNFYLLFLYIIYNLKIDGLILFYRELLMIRYFLIVNNSFDLISYYWVFY